MTFGRMVVLFAGLGSLAIGQDEDFHIYKDPPRVFLNAQRLRRLQRETTRESLRWRQLSMTVEAQVVFPEPGFAWALHYAATSKAESAKTAIDWAMLPTSTDIRQIALVYDWCQKAMPAAAKTALATKLRRALTAEPLSLTTPVAKVRSLTLAAAALGEDSPAESEKTLKYVVLEWWRKGAAKQLNEGRSGIGREDLPALFEIMHVLQDGLKIDMREDARRFFKDLPTWHLLSHYPAPMQGADNEYRVPVFAGGSEPDQNVAALSRAVELMMVAYDVNAIESQFLQGFLIQDRFLMRGPFGLPYEFLWANPYQPGLPFEKMDPFFHDALGGRFFVRSSWEEDATWFGFFDGKMQLFSDGAIKTLKPESFTKPVEFGGVTIMQGHEDMKFQLDADEGAHYFILGLPAKTAYDIEVDDEEMYEAVSDASGILSLEFAKGTKARVWLHKPGRGV